MSYYEHNLADGAPLGVLTLGSVVDIRATKLKKSEKLAAHLPSARKTIDMHKYGIELDKKDGTSHLLCCNDGDDQLTWIRALKKAVAAGRQDTSEGKSAKLMVRCAFLASFYSLKLRRLHVIIAHTVVCDGARAQRRVAVSTRSLRHLPYGDPDGLDEEDADAEPAQARPTE